MKLLSKEDAVRSHQAQSYASEVKVLALERLNRELQAKVDSLERNMPDLLRTKLQEYEQFKQEMNVKRAASLKEVKDIEDVLTAKREELYRFVEKENTLVEWDRSLQERERKMQERERHQT